MIESKIITKNLNNKDLFSDINKVFGLAMIDADNVFADETEVYSALKILEFAFDANMDNGVKTIMKKYKDMLSINKDIETVCVKNIKVIQKNFCTNQKSELVEISWKIAYAILRVVYQKKWGDYNEFEI